MNDKTGSSSRRSCAIVALAVVFIAAFVLLSWKSDLHFDSWDHPDPRWRPAR